MIKFLIFIIVVLAMIQLGFWYIAWAMSEEEDE